MDEEAEEGILVAEPKPLQLVLGVCVRTEYGVVVVGVRVMFAMLAV